MRHIAKNQIHRGACGFFFTIGMILDDGRQICHRGCEPFIRRRTTQKRQNRGDINGFWLIDRVIVIQVNDG